LTKNKDIRLWLGLALAAAAALCMEGCTTPPPLPEPEPPPPPREVDYSVTARSRACPLGIRVKTMSGSAEASDVADMIKTKILAALPQEQFSAETEDEQFGIGLTVMTGFPIQSGSLHAYRGIVDADIRRWHDQKMLDRRAFSVKGPQAEGEGAALRGLGDALGEKLVPWIISTLDAGKHGLAAEEITIHRNWNEFLIRSRRYSRLFLSEVGQLNGVISCECVSKDVQRKEVVFRVVYQKSRFPVGVMGEIMEMERLSIKF